MRRALPEVRANNCTVQPASQRDQDDVRGEGCCNFHMHGSYRIRPGFVDVRDGEDGTQKRTSRKCGAGYANRAANELELLR